jgi:hypothetical protein
MIVDEVNRHLDQTTRLEIIDADGRSYVNWAAHKITLSLQDDGRTLKIFCSERQGAGAAPQTE